VSVDVDERDDTIFLLKYGTKVTRHINAAVSFPRSVQGVIFKEWMERFFLENTHALIEVLAHYPSALSVCFFESGVEENHYLA